MARDANAPSTDGDPRRPVRLTVLGVDPADPRAAAELPRWIPTGTTALYRVPALEQLPAADRVRRSNPPGAVRAVLRSLHRDADVSALERAVDAAAAECEVPVGEVAACDPGVRDRAVRDASALDGTDGCPSLAAEPSRWWTRAAWTVTATCLLAPIAAVALVLAGGLLLALLGVLLIVAAVALLVGFGLAQEAAAIQRADLAVAAAIAEGGDTAGRGIAENGHQTIVVPVRHAAGIAAAIRKRGIPADARRVAAGEEPSAEP